MLAIDNAFQERFVAAGFGIRIAWENEDIKPQAGEPYAELRVLQNNVTPATLAHSDDTDGVFRVILRWPVEVGAYDIRKKADEIFSVFRIGTCLVYENVKVWVMGNSRQPGVAEGGWYKLILDMPYRANIAR